MLIKKRCKNSGMQLTCSGQKGRSNMAKKTKGERMNLHCICGMDTLGRYKCCTKKKEIFTLSMAAVSCADHSLTILFFGLSCWWCSMAGVGEPGPRLSQYMQVCVCRCRSTTCRSNRGQLVKTRQDKLLAVLVLAVLRNRNPRECPCGWAAK